MVSFLTDTVVCGFSLYHILAYFLIYSCIGWCLEVIYAAATTGQLVNRGFLNGPVCPIYGFGMIIVLFALTPLQHSILLLYIGGVILPSALELVGGWALYKIYHTRWWDYSDFPFNIGGYICLEFCLLWGVGTLVVMRIVHPVVADLVDLIPPFVGVILMCFLYAVYAADVVATAIAASALADTLDTMEQLGDSIHAVSDAMTQLLGTTTLNADKKLDEGRLQFKLAAAEARDAAGKRPSARETMAAIRAKAAEATEAARRASEDARLNAAEAANAARLACVFAVKAAILEVTVVPIFSPITSAMPKYKSSTPLEQRINVMAITAAEDCAHIVIIPPINKNDKMEKNPHSLQEVIKLMIAALCSKSICMAFSRNVVNPKNMNENPKINSPKDFF